MNRNRTCFDNTSNMVLNNAYCKANNGEPNEEIECELSPCPGIQIIQ